MIECEQDFNVMSDVNENLSSTECIAHILIYTSIVKACIET